MRTDVKVGIICAFAIVLCVVIYFVTKGRPQPLPAHADVATSHVTPNSDLHPVSPGTPSNPVVSSDPLLPDHTLGGSAVGGGVIHMPGDTASATAPAVAPGTPTVAAGAAAASPLGGTQTGTSSPTTPGMSGAMSPLPTTPTISAGPSYSATPVTPVPGAITPAPTVPTIQYSGSSSPHAAGTTVYLVQKGDMLVSIAKKNGITLRALEEANPGVDSSHLKIKQPINIPAATASATSGHSTTPTTPGAATPGASLAGATGAHGTTAAGSMAASRSRTTEVRTTTPSIKPGSTYVIKKGDTLASIARAAYGDAGGKVKIFRANRGELDDPDVMPVGASIKIP